MYNALNTLSKNIISYNFLIVFKIFESTLKQVFLNTVSLNKKYYIYYWILNVYYNILS